MFRDSGGPVSSIDHGPGVSPTSLAPMSEPPIADILIVDDEPANLLAMEAALGDLGGRTVRAHSGAEALRLLLERDFALIMLDVKMPSLGGFETAQLIRERKRSRHTPIIFVTAYGRDEGDILSAYKLGAVDFLFKPIVAEIVQAKAGVFVELQRRTAEIARQAEQLREHELREHEQTLVEQRLRWDEEVMRRERDALADADRRKDEFIAILGHELRNPLAAVVAGLAVLGRKLSREADADAALHRTHARIDRQIAHLTRLVDDLVDVARINSSKVELRLERISIQELIEQAVSMCRPMFAERQQSLSVSTPDGPVILHVDAVRITQVLANLLSNAARYTPEGGAIRVGCERQEAFVEVVVADNGRGIDPDLLPRVFEMFVQAKEPGDSGLGLGLAIVRRLVTMHDGTVTVSSPGTGRGSEFRVRLRVAAPEAVGPAPQQPEAPAKVDRARQLVVLVEDNEDLREGVKELIEDMGHKVEVAEDGQAGAELILRLEPDVAFVDIGLPVVDGYGVAVRVREQLGSDRVKLVAMTGFGQSSDRLRSKDAGFDTHVVKPPTVEILQGILSPEKN
jgi:two-component system, sensor histidine kinase